MADMNRCGIANESVCVDTKRIYDSCISKDCLENLRVTFCEDAQRLIDGAASVKARDAVLTAVSVDVDEIPFNRGYYNVDIHFYFRLRFDTYSAPCSASRTAVGFVHFQKRCILFGGEGNVKVFTSVAGDGGPECPEAPQYTNPVAKVQAVDPVILDYDVMEVCHCHHHCCTSFPASVLDAMNGGRFPQNPEKAVTVTLGLFSIIQLSREVQMLMPAYDFCIPDRECACSDQRPCDNFRDMEFPMEDFFPPDTEDCNC